MTPPVDQSLALSLNPLTAADIDRLRRWRNRVRSAFVDSRYLTKKAQRQWYRQYQKDSSQKIYLIKAKRQPIGIIGLKLTPPTNPDFGPAILGDLTYARRGVMTWAYRELMRLHPAPKYHGLVKKSNPKALALDLKVGFQVVKTDQKYWYVEFDSIKRIPVIPLLKPSPSPAEIKAVKRVLQSSWWGLGPVTAQLETAFAAFVGTTYAIAVNSCSAALHLSVHILSRRFPKKTNLVTTPLTFISTAAAGLYENLEVRFGDIEEQTLCLDPQDALAKADALTLTIIPVHYAGILSPIPQTPLPIIEDCAHAAGTPGAGHSSLLACWSFHPVKNIATGDGGMITTNDRQLAAELRRLRWLGIDQDTWAREQKGYNWEYQIPSLGFKYHTNDIMSAIALEQLKRLPTLNRRRRRLAKRYRTGLKDLPLILPPPSGSWHLYPIRLHRASLRPRLIQYLRDHHISVGVHYQPLHHYPFFNWHQPLPVTDRVYPTLLDLPIFPDMTLAEQDYVIHTLHDFYNL